MATSAATAQDLGAAEPVVHPRFTTALYGHGAAERALLAAWSSGRMPHAWMLVGPRGIGKATLAYRLARFLIGRPDAGTETGGGLFGDALPEDRPAENLAIDPEDPVFRRIAAGAHGNLLAIERRPDPKTGKTPAIIPVDAVRAINAFLEKSAAEGGWRVVIVDAADELNRNGANALLKILEEPPAKSVLILVTHRPGVLPATIRSRCRVLDMRSLGDDDMAAFLAEKCADLAPDDIRRLTRLAEGTPARALALAGEGGLEVYRRLLDLLAGLPRPDRGRVHALAGDLAGAKAEASYRLFVELLLGWIGRLVRTRAGGGAFAAIDDNEARLAARIGPLGGLDRWLEVWEKVARLTERAEALNLDRKQVVLSIASQLEDAVAGR